MTDMKLPHEDDENRSQFYKTNSVFKPIFLSDLTENNKKKLL